MPIPTHSTVLHNKISQLTILCKSACTAKATLLLHWLLNQDDLAVVSPGPLHLEEYCTIIVDSPRMHRVAWRLVATAERSSKAPLVRYTGRKLTMLWWINSATADMERCAHCILPRAVPCFVVARQCVLSHLRKSRLQLNHGIRGAPQQLHLWLMFPVMSPPANLLPECPTRLPAVQ